jgi:hypothetical protein
LLCTFFYCLKKFFGFLEGYMNRFHSPIIVQNLYCVNR